MKTKSLILVISIMLFGSLQNTFAQNTIEKQDTTLTLDHTKITYTCPMHSEIVSDKSGNCPRCGMKLVKLENGEKQSAPMQPKKGMMCPMPGMSDMNQNNNEQKKGHMMMGMGIGMGILMVIMMVVMLL